MTKEEIEDNFETAKKALEDLEQVVLVQKEVYAVHNGRIEGLKFLWNRVQVLKALETAVLENNLKAQELAASEAEKAAEKESQESDES